MITAIKKIQKNISHLWSKSNPLVFSEKKQLDLAAEMVPFGTWEYDLLSGYINWNQPLYDLFGVDRKNFDHTLSTFKEMMHPDDRPKMEILIQRAIHDSVRDMRYTFRLCLPHQPIRYFRGNAQLVYNKKKEPIGLTGVCIDITTQKLTEKQLKKERDKATLYLNSVEAMIVVLNTDATIRFMNNAGYKITEYSETEVKGKNWYKLFAPEHLQEDLEENYQQIIDGNAIYMEYYEREIISKSGHNKCIAWRNTLLKNEQEQITGVLATGTDITEKVMAEKQSQAMKKMYKDIFENSVTPMLICDSYLRYKDVNDAACQLLGYAKKELLDMHVWQLTRPDKHKETLMLWSDFISTKYQTGTIELFKKDGTKIIVEYQATSEFTPGMHLASMNDITQKKIAEQKLKEQNEKLRKIAWMQSHEVRKPLANILGLLALIDSQKTAAMQEHVFQYLKQSSDELDQIIKDIIEKTKAVDA